MDGKDSSPWCVNNLDEFLYYCCPKCDERNKSKDSFLKHALGEHSEAQKYLQKFTVKENFHMKSVNEECLSNLKRYEKENEIKSEEGEIDQNSPFVSNWNYIIGKAEIDSKDKIEYSEMDSKLTKCCVPLVCLKQSDINERVKHFSKRHWNIKVPSKAKTPLM